MRSRKTSFDAAEDRIQAFGDRFIAELPGAEWFSHRWSRNGERPDQISPGRLAADMRVMDGEFAITGIRLSHADALAFARWLAKRPAK